MLEPIRTYLKGLSGPPEPLTAAQRWLFALAALFVAVTRFRARSLTPWDWDEALFSLAMDEYDVSAHRPHPPGFPLFIAAAKLVRPFVDSNFHALQWVALAGAIALFPAIVQAAREARLPFGTALGAGFLCSFVPSVWFFGGTAFSDVPSIALAVAAIALLLRGCRDRRAYLAGAFVLALAIGFRTQNLAIAMVPGLIATGHRLRARDFGGVALAAVTGLAIVGATYGAAVWATGSWASYSWAVEAHRDYIESVDSFRNPNRTPLPRLTVHFFVMQYSHYEISIVITLFVLLSGIVAVIRRNAPVLLFLASFVPFCVSAWLLLDLNSVQRFSIGYMPLFVVLASDGMRLAATFVERMLRLLRTPSVHAALLIATVAILIEWTNPALRVVRTTESPTAAATEWIRRNLDRETSVIYAAGGMLPFSREGLTQFRTVELRGDAIGGIAPADRAMAYLLTDATTDQPGNVMFLRKRDRLSEITRDKYFAVSVFPLETAVEFKEGWYGLESGTSDTWRWMASRSRTLLPRVDGPAALGIVLGAPAGVPGTTTVTLTLNGVQLDRFPVGSEAEPRHYSVEAEQPLNELVIETDRVLNPLKAGLSHDPRDLGVVLESLSWRKSSDPSAGTPATGDQ